MLFRSLQIDADRQRPAPGEDLRVSRLQQSADTGETLVARPGQLARPGGRLWWRRGQLWRWGRDGAPHGRRGGQLPRRSRLRRRVIWACPSLATMLPWPARACRAPRPGEHVRRGSGSSSCWPAIGHRAIPASPRSRAETRAVALRRAQGFSESSFAAKGRSVALCISRWGHKLAITPRLGDDALKSTFTSCRSIC